MERKTEIKTMATVINMNSADSQVKTPAASTSVNGTFQSLESFITASFDVNTQSLKTLSYHEMAEVPVLEEDSLDQLRRNIKALGTATEKLRFMNREIRYLLKV